MATDQECRVVIDTWASLHDRIVGYSTPYNSPNGLNRSFGAPYYIRDDRLPPGKQELWRGDSRDEMLYRCEIERMRVALDALRVLSSRAPEKT
jgi:hypothetical protein